MKTPVIATKEGVLVRTYPNMEVARKELRITRNRLIELIITGEDMDGLIYDWDQNADTSVTDGIEERWMIRKENLAESKERSRRNVELQKEMQKLWVQESFIQQDGNMRRVRITAETVVQVPPDNDDGHSDGEQEGRDAERLQL